MQWWHAAALIYLVPAAVWVISENRRPRATFAWLFLFIALPVIGLVAYVMIGRQTTIQRMTRRDLRQNLPGHLTETLAHLDEGHERTVAFFEGDPLRRDRLAALVRASAHSRVTPDNRVQVLQNAAQTYPALHQALRGARHSIHLEYYSWASDSVGEALREILVAKVAEGVEVRLLYDSIGSIGMLKRSYVRSMREAGIEMIPFSPPWQVHTLSYRNHRKIVVVDGRVGFAGGLNIGHEHVEPGQGYELWRDTHLRIDGPAVLSLQGVFAVDWANASGQSLLGEGYFPSVGDTTPRSNEVVDCAIDRDGVPVQVCLSGPDSEREAIQQFYFAAIAAARRQVLLTSPYFVLDEAIAEALRTAALAGVDVRVMISAREPGWPVPNWAANTYAAEIAEAGAQVLLYERGYLHAKTIVVDGELCAVGSANWDIRSFAINYEITQLLYDKPLSREMVATFERDTADCRPFDAEGYRERPRLVRFRDSVARLASPIL
jgi:cardiolipin synthase